MRSSQLDLTSQLGSRLRHQKPAADVPRDRLSEEGLPADLTYQLVHDHLMLDGNARLNLATFVGTWMEPEARRLMEECADKNMIDKDEYPQTAELEERCLKILADLWHAPDPDQAIGTSTTGSSEGCMLGGLALKWRWRERRRGAGLDASRPNLVMGINTQVCWEKFCTYFDVEPRLVPLEQNRLHLTPEEALKQCDENTIGVVGIVGSTFDGSYEPIDALQTALDALHQRSGLDIPIHVDAASGGFVAPFNSPDWAWDFRLSRVVSISSSGHKYGGVLPGVGWVLWRSGDHLPEELRFNVNYLGGEMPTIGLNFSRSGAQVVGQYFNFLHLGRQGYSQRMASLEAIACHLADGLAAMEPLRLVSHPRGQLPVFAVECDPSIKNWTVFHLSKMMRSRGWQVPAYTLPANLQDRAVLRFVIRAGFNQDMADQLLADVQRNLAWLATAQTPLPSSSDELGFRH
ncbi:glutamate decarboxylase [Synechococcus sp. CCY9201]|uniref:glutamate decarboxylase n=1 Tax=unclassified Synechococcus TaxID=2626047 RepID=UPI002AD53799|nr:MULTISPECIES: glutamate decarboxylase [unclassified Synechococcus]MEA5473182.1 glutamate decarboxylase [Synechococcus sp. CCY9201]CAK6695091.1 Glutamate decarboxylase [Synechococcus sp. CBW1107]